VARCLRCGAGNEWIAGDRLEIAEEAQDRADRAEIDEDARVGRALREIAWRPLVIHGVPDGTVLVEFDLSSPEKFFRAPTLAEALEKAAGEER
jgi:hypothetical protein